MNISALIDELAQERTKKERISGADRANHSVERVDRDHSRTAANGERGNKPFELETILRIHLLQELYDCGVALI